MTSLLQRSPETTYAGLAALVGLALVLLGLLFAQEKVWQAGLVIVSAAASLLGFVSRSERQHLKDTAVPESPEP
jgi:hypothetical protein